MKRRHSAGDMLDDAQYSSVGRNTSQLRLEGPKARIVLTVDLGEFFSDLGSGGRKKYKKALKMTS